jgi:ABC-type nickel/cobalt efflux system permease component RcnA
VICFLSRVRSLDVRTCRPFCDDVGEFRNILMDACVWSLALGADQNGAKRERWLCRAFVLLMMMAVCVMCWNELFVRRTDGGVEKSLKTALSPQALHPHNRNTTDPSTHPAAINFFSPPPPPRQRYHALDTLTHGPRKGQDHSHQIAELGWNRILLHHP